MRTYSYIIYLSFQDFLSVLRKSRLVALASLFLTAYVTFCIYAAPAASSVNNAVNVSFAIVMTGMVIQTYRITHRQHSNDISLWDIGFRGAATGLFMWKNVTLGDSYMQVGQASFIAFFVLYVITVVKYRKN